MVERKCYSFGCNIMISQKTTLVLALSIWYFDSLLSDIISGIKVNNPYDGISFCDIWKSVLMLDIKKKDWNSKDNGRLKKSLQLSKPFVFKKIISLTFSHALICRSCYMNLISQP
uniref:Putative ovule protein n=1 Tax=Solanum chacoense TaxID=4108 RepID=A0A0V0HVB6_SOLCH